MVQSMCGWGGSGFPGSQPVSMDQKNINFLHLEPYRVSWKADGTRFALSLSLSPSLWFHFFLRIFVLQPFRYMMLVLQENEIYFFDRDNSCFQVEGLRFPHHSDFKRHLTKTLLDGVSNFLFFFNKIPFTIRSRCLVNRAIRKW